MGKRLKNFLGIKKRTKKLRKILRGSLRDPLFCLGIASVILFGAVSLSSDTLLKSLSTQQGDFSLANMSNAAEGLVKDDSYINSSEKFRLESPELLIIGNSSIQASAPPTTFSPQVLGSLIGSFDYDETSREIIEYTVEPGDNLWSISQSFNVSMDTLVWANDIKSPIISVGQKLLVLPVTGMMHIVEPGDTASELAELYETDIDKIIAFNNLSDEKDLFIGEVLVIPDGEKPGYADQARESRPFTQLSTNNFYGNSHAYPYGQCTWWVAQKRVIPAWGNAADWLNSAQVAGRATCAGSYCVPQWGSVIVLAGHRVYGHVGYVEQVKGDKVIFSEMNYIGWGKMNYRTLQVGSPSIKGYIY